MAEHNESAPFLIGGRLGYDPVGKPSAVLAYDCPCGERHTVFRAVTEVLSCGHGHKFTDESRYSVTFEPFPTPTPPDHA